jgi:hypothetical protein
MTVTANTTRNQYSAGNQQNTYAYTFQIHDASDLKVYIGDELKSLNTVTGVGSGTGGNVVFDLGVDGNGDPIYIPQDTVVSIFLAMDLDRDTNYQPSGAFLAADVNNDFDRLWIASNQQQTDINRSVRLQDTDSDASMVLPKIADRADKLLGFSSALSGATPVTINNNYAQWDSAYDNMITGMQLPSNGILRLSQQDGSDYTVDLDSRYHNIGTDIPDADISESSVTQHRTAMLDIPNNVKAKFGNGDELQIYSDGYTSYIKESGNGNLAILGDFLFLGNPDGTKNYLVAQDGTGVGLYHNGTLKVATSADGISVTGTITATGYNDTNWNTAYSWGNHASAGYLTSFDITTQTDPKYLRADENDTTTGTLTAAGLIAGGLTYPTSDGSSNQVLVTDGNGTLSFANQSGGGGGSSSTLTYNGATKAEATATGIDVTGNVSLPDNGKAKFGAGNDLQIYHDGTNSIIDNSGSGSLIIQDSDGNGDILIRPKSGQTAIGIYNDNTVQLAHSGNIKLSTTSTGIDVTGTVTADGLTVTGTLGNWSIDTQGAIQDFTRDSTNFIRASNSVGNLMFQTGGGNHRQFIANNGDISFYEDTGTTPKLFWDASAESLGIGTSSPSEALEVNGKVKADTHFTSSDNAVTLSTSGDGGSVYLRPNGNSQSAGQVIVDSSGNVGIGTTSPSAMLDVELGATGTIAEFRGGDSDILQIKNENDLIVFDTRNTASGLAFQMQGTEHMRMDVSGNLLVGKTANDNTTVGTRIDGQGLVSSVADGDVALLLNRKTSDGAIALFRKDGTTVGSIGARANYLNIGSGDTGLLFNSASDRIQPESTTGGARDAAIDLGGTTTRFKDLYLSGNVHTGDGTAASPAYTFSDDTDTGIFSPAADTIAFSEGGTEAMRISSSGNVGIGKTDPLRKIDMAYAKTADDTIGLRINNTATSYDGKVISVCKGSSSAEQGVIGYADGFALQSFYIAAGVAGLRCQTEFGSSPRLSPCSSTGALRDNTTDLGASNARFDDIYATNTSIISTSDSTLKQDVETLTDAEERVAIACKGLLRKFRWRDAVAEKGDEARIHFGIMAQDLRDAFTAEGLDAHKYGMFCSNTWWEHEDEYYPTADSAPEGATEVTRMGVRYSELLAFIISAI